MTKVIPFSISTKASEYRRRAEEHRAIAKSAADKDQRERNEIIAAAYLSLAQTEEWLAGARAHPVPNGGENVPPADRAQA